MITTVQQHIRHQQQNFAEASGTFSVAAQRPHPRHQNGRSQDPPRRPQRRARRQGLRSTCRAKSQQKLDVYANEALLHILGGRDSVAALVSEENEEPVIINADPESGRYIIVFDPLDGSSNIDVNVNVGTIFSIRKRLPGQPLEPAILQPGSSQVAAGYVVYGPSTMLVYTAGDGVYGFTLDPAIGAFVLTNDNMKMPEQGPYYSTNEANEVSWPLPYQQFVNRLRRGQLNGQAYSSRYIGSLVADFHRTLLKGGVFLYPPTEKAPNGKLRLLYEANPLAFIVEQAGGAAINGAQRVLDLQPESIHQRTPFVLGSRVEVETLQAMVKKEAEDTRKES